MNNIFIKNIGALQTKNPELAQRLQNYVPTEVPQLIQENNTYNIVYKGKYIQQ